MNAANMTEALIEIEAIDAAKPDLLHHRLTMGAVLMSVTINILWGTNPAALKIALHSLPPIGASGIRFAIAAIGVWIWCAFTGVRTWPRKGEGRWLAIVGAFFAAQIATFSLGVYWGSASHSVVILNTYPFFVVALAHFFIPGDRATPGRFFGLIAAFAGIVALFASEWGAWKSHQLLGDSIQLLSALILGGQVVYTKHAVARIEADRVVLWQMVLGAIALLSYGFAFEHLAGARPDTASTIAVVYQGLIIGTLCFTVWTWLIRRHAASRVAIFGFIAPLIGVLLSAFLLHEQLSAMLLTSAGLVASGIVLANIW